MSKTMTNQFVLQTIKNKVGFLTLDRPKALNSLSLDMVRAITSALLDWRADSDIDAVVICGSTEKAFCAGGDIRFFHDMGLSTPRQGSALIEDFFTEEYALNHLIHCFPKPYIAFMDGVIMGGGMGIAQSGPSSRLRIVTDRTKMAMPEVNIGLFPDVGGSFFLSRCPGRIGAYLGLTGDVITAADALTAGLADVYVPSADCATLIAKLEETSGTAMDAVASFAAPFRDQIDPASGRLSMHRAQIDRHFSSKSVAEIVASLSRDDSPFAQQTLAMMQKRSPLMMCVTLEQIRRGASLGIADCLRMERTMVRRAFEHGEVIEGVRAMVIDKDNQPVWKPSSLPEVTPEMVDAFFAPAWPDHAHPLRSLV